MLNLNNANRLYTDRELMKKFAKYIITNNYGGARLEEAVEMFSKIVDYDPDFVRGFLRQAMRG